MTSNRSLVAVGAFVGLAIVGVSIIAYYVVEADDSRSIADCRRYMQDFVRGHVEFPGEPKMIDGVLLSGHVEKPPGEIWWRDFVEFPIDPKNTSGEAIAACGGADGPIHANVTHILYADGSIREVDVRQLRNEGSLGKDQSLVLGVGSALPELRALKPGRIRLPSAGR
jgi:hypothetical protein